MTNINTLPQSNRFDRFGSEEMLYMEASQAHWRLTIRPTAWRPPTDVIETQDAIIVRVEIAGIHDDDFTIELDGRLLSIRGIRPDTTEKRAYHQMEIRFGEFFSEVELPVQVIPDQIDAKYFNGFLRLTLPKARPHNIPVADSEA